MGDFDFDLAEYNHYLDTIGSQMRNKNLNKGWELSLYPAKGHFPDRYEIMPINDTKEHSDGDAYCWCTPQITVTEGGVLTLIHHAEDKREMRENGDHLKLVADNEDEN